MPDPQNQFPYHRAVCAPKTWPIRLVHGALHAADGTHVKLLPYELVHNGWGDSALLAMGPGMPTPLPHALSVTWLSLAENTFYSGQFPLPLARLQDLFESGFTHPTIKEHCAWTTILIGLAPGGHASVWLSGVGFTAEVCHHKVHAVDIPWANVPGTGPTSRDSWVQSKLQLVLGEEGLRTLAAGSVNADRWDRFRIRFPWRPLLLGALSLPAHGPATLRLRGWNGEAESIAFSSSPTEAAEPTLPSPSTRSAPQSMELRYTGPDSVRRVAKVQFDEAETFAAFSKLSGDNGAMPPLSLHFDVTEPAQGLRIYLCDSTYSLELLAAHVAVYKSA